MKNPKIILFIFLVSLILGVFSFFLSLKAVIIIVGIIALLTSSLLIYLGIGTFRLPTFPLVFFVFYVILIYLGSFQIFFEYNMDTPLYIISVILTLLVFPMGVIFANFILKYKPKKESLDYLKKPIKKENYDFKNVSLFVFLLILSIFFSFLYLYQLPNIPLISAIRNPGQRLLISKAREEATVLFPGKFHWYSFFFASLLPFLSIIALVKSMTATSRRKLWKIFALLIILFTSFMLLANMKKGPIIVYGLGLGAAFVIAKKGLKMKNILIFGILVFIFLIAVYSLWAGLFSSKLGIEENFSALVSVYNRITLAQTNGLYWYFKIFPNIQGFLMGKSLPNPGGLLSYKPISLSRYVYSFVFPESEIEGSFPTVFFGEIYANFGFWIMFLSVFLMGFILQVAQVYFIRKPKTILMVSFMSFLMIYVKNLTVTSLFQVVDIFLLLLILVVVLFNAKIIYKRKKIQYES